MTFVKAQVGLTKQVLLAVRAVNEEDTFHSETHNKETNLNFFKQVRSSSSLAAFLDNPLIHGHGEIEARIKLFSIPRLYQAFM